MASYKLRWKRSAQKELRSVHKTYIPQILEAVEELEQNPYPTGIRKLSATEHAYRLRVGPYRILYNVSDSESIVEVVRIRHRKDAYKK